MQSADSKFRAYLVSFPELLLKTYSYAGAKIYYIKAISNDNM